jgi:hypothetical protein
VSLLLAKCSIEECHGRSDPNTISEVRAVTLRN